MCTATNTTSTTNMKKTVRFVEENDERNTVHVYEAFSTDILWMTCQENREMKKEQQAQTMKLRRGGADRLFEQSFANPASDVQRALNDFTRHTDGRGLERQTCSKHLEERMMHRALALQAILLGQKQARKQGLEDVTEQLRALSLQYCCTAKIFARRMGKADEYACYKKTKTSSSRSSSNGSVYTSKTTSTSKTSKAPKSIKMACPLPASSSHSLVATTAASRTV